MQEVITGIKRRNRTPMTNVTLCKPEPPCGYGRNTVIEQGPSPIQTGKGVG